MRDWLKPAIQALSDAPLTEDSLREHVFPLFSRVLKRDEIYLANHSLGRPPDQTSVDLHEAVDLWYDRMDGAWEPWLAANSRYCDLVRELIGGGPDDGVVHKMSAGAALRTILNASPAKDGTVPNVVSTLGEFDAVDTVLRIYAQKGKANVNWVEADEQGLVRAEAITHAINETTDLVVFSPVFFSTGSMLEGAKEIIERAHRVGAAVVLDTYHAAGAMPFSFRDLGADFAIGGNYKYTRGGPGAAWLAISADKLDAPEWMPIDTGWFAKDDHFGFGRGDDVILASGAAGWQEGTPGVLLPVQAIAGLELTLAIGLDRLRAYNQHQQAVLIERLQEAGIEPRLHEPRGAFLLVPASDPLQTAASLKTLGVNVDGRTDPAGRGHIRLCPDMLNTQDEFGKAAPLVAQALEASTPVGS